MREAENPIVALTATTAIHAPFGYTIVDGDNAQRGVVLRDRDRVDQPVARAAFASAARRSANPRSTALTVVSSRP